MPHGGEKKEKEKGKVMLATILLSYLYFTGAMWISEGRVCAAPPTPVVPCFFNQNG
jgi:hypothetical protein